jgi:hypothetical protein
LATDPPVCSQLSTTVRIQSLVGPLKLVCKVDAQPSEVEFRWSANSSAAKFHSGHDYNSDGLSSTLTLEPTLITSDRDVVIQCVASNTVGTTRQPCLFTFIPPTSPPPITDCQLRNRTATGLVVDCVPPAPGGVGGLAQSFYLEVFDSNQVLVMNVSNDEAPVFAVGGLVSQASYSARVYAVNQLGKSPAFDVKLQTHKLFNKKFSKYFRLSVNYS